jgi:hypothetical protein
MNVFQFAVVAMLSAVVLFDTACFLRRRRARGMWLIRTVIWVLMTTAVMFPQLAQALANLLGIHRGADLVLYVFVIGATFVAFHLYSRNRSMEIQITELVRVEALRIARDRSQRDEESA